METIAMETLAVLVDILVTLTNVLVMLSSWRPSSGYCRLRRGEPAMILRRVYDSINRLLGPCCADPRRHAQYRGDRLRRWC